MTYLNDLADTIRACVPKGTDIPDAADDLFILYALLARVKGHAVRARDVHDAWSVWMARVDPHHEALVPFDELDEETQQEDGPFLCAIRDALDERGAADAARP